MKPAAPPSQPAHSLDRLLGDARSLVLDLIGLAAAAFLMDASRRGLGKAMRRFVVPAEAALRRAILLIAATLPRPPAAPVKRPPAPPPVRAARAATPHRRAARAPVFRLSEPSGLSLGAKRRAASTPVPAAPRRPTDFAVLARRFTRRLTALEAASANPAAEAQRWLRRRLRPSGAVHPLRFDRIPGFSRRLPEPAQSTLKALNIAALRCVAEADTS